MLPATGAKLTGKFKIVWAPKRPPDFTIGSQNNPYMDRWYLTPWSRWRNRTPEGRNVWDLLPGVYLHWIYRSDDDRALHDHPWFNVSIVISGGYYETTKRGTKWRGAGSVVFRRATTAHRLTIPEYAPRLTTTLFITGPKLREWGFHCPQGWVPWTKFVEPTRPGEIGRGCN